MRDRVVAALQRDPEAAGAEVVRAQDVGDRRGDGEVGAREAALGREVGGDQQLRLGAAGGQRRAAAGRAQRPDRAAGQGARRTAFAARHRDPHAAGAERQRARRAAERGRRHDAVGGRIDAADGAGHAVGRPDRVGVGGDAVHAEFERDRPLQRRRAGVDPPHDARVRVGHPDRSGAHGEPRDRRPRDEDAFEHTAAAGVEPDEVRLALVLGGEHRPDLPAPGRHVQSPAARAGPASRPRRDRAAPGGRRGPAPTPPRRQRRSGPAGAGTPARRGAPARCSCATPAVLTSSRRSCAGRAAERARGVVGVGSDEPHRVGRRGQLERDRARAEGACGVVAQVDARDRLRVGADRPRGAAADADRHRRRADRVASPSPGCFAGSITAIASPSDPHRSCARSRARRVLAGEHDGGGAQRAPPRPRRAPASAGGGRRRRARRGPASAGSCSRIDCSSVAQRGRRARARARWRAGAGSPGRRRAPRPGGRCGRARASAGRATVRAAGALDQLGELGDERGVAAEREVGVDPVLDRGQPLLLQPPRGGRQRVGRARPARARARARAPRAAEPSRGRDRRRPAPHGRPRRARRTRRRRARPARRSARSRARG